MEDLPYTLQGLEAPSFHWNPDFSVTIVPDLPPGAAALTHLILEPAVLFQKIKTLQLPQGLLIQALWDCVETHLQKYRVLLGGLERRAPRLSLIQCYDILFDAIRGLRALWAILKYIEGSDMHIFSVLHPFTCHGDPFIANFASQLYSRARVPFDLMLEEWTTHGILNDPFDEFFIEFSDPESVWINRFRLRPDRLPREMTREKAQQIYESGKNIYFLRELCQYISPVSDTKVAQVLIERYELLAHFQALHDYLLLARGDFAACLINEALPALGQDHDNLYRHELVSILETAIITSNAQFDSPSVISCLDARMLDLGHDVKGWQVFTLEYKVESPLDVIIDQRVQLRYLQIFNMLWRLRWAAANLQYCYKVTNGRNSSFTSAESDDAVSCWRFQADLCQMMQHLFNELQSYIYTNLIGREWSKFISKVKAAHSVDGIVEAHYKFLSTIVENPLFGDKQVTSGLHHMFDQIIEFRSVVETIEALMKVGSSLEAGVERLEKLTEEYSQEMQELMELLRNLEDESKSLSTRINFNGFYIVEE